MISKLLSWIAVLTDLQLLHPYPYIMFTGKPSKPKGPIKVSDVTAEGCKLKWDKPEDDGGEPVDHYVIERMDTETGRWVPVGTSKTPEAEVLELSINFRYLDF